MITFLLFAIYKTLNYNNRVDPINKTNTTCMILEYGNENNIPLSLIVLYLLNNFNFALRLFFSHFLPPHALYTSHLSPHFFQSLLSVLSSVIISIGSDSTFKLK